MGTSASSRKTDGNRFRRQPHIARSILLRKTMFYAKTAVRFAQGNGAIFKEPLFLDGAFANTIG